MTDSTYYPCEVCGAPVSAERVAAIGRAVCPPVAAPSVLTGAVPCAVAGTVNGATGTAWPRTPRPVITGADGKRKRRPVTPPVDADVLRLLPPSAVAPSGGASVGDLLRIASVIEARREPEAWNGADIAELMGGPLVEHGHAYGDRGERVPVATDGNTWPLAAWQQGEERGPDGRPDVDALAAMAPAFLAFWHAATGRPFTLAGRPVTFRPTAPPIFAALWRAMTGARLTLPGTAIGGALPPVAWREAVTLAGATERTAPFTFTTDPTMAPARTLEERRQRRRARWQALAGHAVGVTVTVADMPSALDDGGRVQGAATPAVVAVGAWPVGGASDRTCTHTAPGRWEYAPGEYPRRTGDGGTSTGTVLAGRSGRATATSGRVPKRAPLVTGEEMGVQALRNALDAAPDEATRAALRAVPAPRRTGNAAEDRRLTTAYRQRLRRVAGRA